MILITLTNVQMNIGGAPGGARILAFGDAQSGIAVHVPLDENAVAVLRNALSGIEVANQMPDGLRNGH